MEISKELAAWQKYLQDIEQQKQQLRTLLKDRPKHILELENYIIELDKMPAESNRKELIVQTQTIIGQLEAYAELDAAVHLS